MPSVGLPDGAPLAPGESVLMRERFQLSSLAFHLHTDLALTDRRFYASRPNTALGLVVVGTDRKSFPIENIAGIEASTIFSIPGIVVGLVGALVGVLTIEIVPILGFVLIAISLSFVVRSVGQGIAVTNSGGGRIIFPVAFVERRRTVEFADHVAELIARTTHDRPAQRLRPPVAPLSDAAAALKDLEHLREQGLITDAEWQAKRAEILQRI